MAPGHCGAIFSAVRRCRWLSSRIRCISRFSLARSSLLVSSLYCAVNSCNFCAVNFIIYNVSSFTVPNVYGLVFFTSTLLAVKKNDPPSTKKCILILRLQLRHYTRLPSWPCCISILYCFRETTRRETNAKQQCSSSIRDYPI